MNKKSEKRHLNEANFSPLSSSSTQMIKGGVGAATIQTPKWMYISSTPKGALAAATDGYIDGVHVGAGYEAEQID